MKNLILALGIFFCFSNGFAQKNDSLQLLVQLETFNIRDSNSLKSYDSLLYNSKFRFPNEVKTKYFKKGLRHAEELKLTWLFYYYCSQLFLDGFFEKNFDTAYFYADKGLQFAENNYEREQLGIFHAYLGNNYQLHEEYAVALTHYITALEYYDKNEHSKDRGQLLTNIGGIYIELGENDKAQKYLLDAVPCFDNSDPAEKADELNAIFTNLANMYFRMEQLDSLKYYLEKSIEQLPFFENHDCYLYASATAYEEATFLYLKLEEYERAANYLEKAYELRDFLPNYDLLKFDYCLNTQSCSDLKEQFQQHFTQADSSIYFLELKRDYYKHLGLFKEAFQTQLALNRQEKINFGKEKSDYAAYIDAQYEIDKKEKEISLLEKENDLKSSQMRWMIISFLLIFGSILFIYYQAQQKNRLLTINVENKELIQQQADELQKNYELKNQLFGNIAHELRTPLTLINGPITQMLNESQSSAKNSQQMKIVADNSRQLLIMVDQILDLTKSEAGLINVIPYSFQLSELMKYLETQFQILAKNRDIQLTFEGNIGSDLTLTTDVKKLITILKNLVANAVKYSQANDHVTLSYTQLGEELQIKVQDTGQGIQSEELNEIFNRYYQTTNNKSLEGGIGVGLAICKEYIKLLGGWIKAESTPGVGSIFTIQFPKELKHVSSAIQAYDFPIDQISSMTVLPKAVKKESKEEYILVVEDNLDLCQFLYDLLKDHYKLSFAHNGQEALNQISIKKPGLILTDWMMPIMDGKELIIHLKKQPEMALIPILMLTARTDIKDQLSILRIGVDDYLTKPFEANSLHAHIIYLLELAEGRKMDEEISEPVKDELKTSLVLEEKDQLFLDQFEQIILQNISKFGLKLDFVSEEMNLSSRHLGRKVKELLGLTANQYIQEIRFKEAKRMLIQGEYSTVKAVIYSVGFKSEQYFSRNFKKRYGKYPKDFLR